MRDLVIVALGTLACACARRPIQQPAVTAAAEFTSGNLATRPDVEWEVVLDPGRTHVPPEPGGLTLAGPWNIDTNHAEGALLVGADVPVRWFAKEMGGTTDGGFSLRGASVTVHLKWSYANPCNEFDLRRGRLVFAFQTEMPPRDSEVDVDEWVRVRGPTKTRLVTPPPSRRINYAFASVTLNAPALADEEVSFSLTDSLDDWLCLSRNRVDPLPTDGAAAKYTCAVDREDFLRMLSNVKSNVGIWLLLPGYPEGVVLHKDLDPTPVGCGNVLQVRRFEIRR